MKESAKGVTVVTPAKAKARGPGRPRGKAKGKDGLSLSDANAPEDHDGADAQVTEESVESEGKGTKRHQEVPPSENEPQKERKVAEVVENQKHGEENVKPEESEKPAKAVKKEAKSFARRPEPKNPLSNKKWHALRQAFNTLIKPYVQSYSAHEACL